MYSKGGGGAYRGGGQQGFQNVEREKGTGGGEWGGRGAGISKCFNENKLLFSAWTCENKRIAQPYALSQLCDISYLFLHKLKKNYRSSCYRSETDSVG